MSEKIKVCAEKNIVSEILRILKQYPDLAEKLDVLMSYSKEELTELLNAKWIDTRLIDFVAAEEDIYIIKRVVKLNNRGISVSSDLISFAMNERKAEILDETCDYINARSAYELYNGMIISQMEECLKALKAGIKLDKIEKFMKPLRDAEKMTQLRKALKSYLCSEKLNYLFELSKTEMSAAQLREVRKCAESARWSAQDIQWIVKRELTVEQFSCVRKSAEKIGWRELAFMANPRFDIKKMKMIGEALEAGVDLAYVKECANKEVLQCEKDLLSRMEMMLSEII